MINLHQMAQALGGEVCGGEVLCPGPGHSAKDRSLAVKPDPNDPDDVICHSHAGDDWRECKDYAREKLGLPPFNGKAINRSINSKIVAIYDYVDEAGNLLFQVVRFNPKNFRQRRPDGKGGWTWSLRETRRVLYRLPELIEAVANERPIFICEGEKAVDALTALGVLGNVLSRRRG